MTTSALELRYRLRQLQRKHQIVPDPVILPLTDPASGPMIFEGTAATCTRDRDRMRLARNALDPLPDPRNVPLLLRHDPAVVAGEIQELDYDHHTLRIRARVEHPDALRMSGFSVGLRILQCELVDADTPDFHGVLHKAELGEVSITDRPSNPEAMVLSRIPACFSDFYAAAARGMRAASGIVQLMQWEIHRHA